MEGRESDGRFKKGARPVGRKKGTKDKVLQEQKSRIDEFFEKHWDEFEKEVWPQLSAKDKKDTFIALANYRYPKLSSVDMKTDQTIKSSFTEELAKKVNDSSII